MPRGFEEGDVVDEAYEVLECIGEGGFGEVYRVRQLSMDRDVAMKVLLKDCDDESAGRFRREVHAVRDLSHPNTIEIYDFAELPDGELYYTMEFVEGDTLIERVQQEGAFGPVETRDILVQVLKSLGEAHDQGIVHRDLKPGNVMLAEVYGEENFVKVLDFGIAKAAESSSSEVLEQTFTASEDLVGTLRYMAPEQATDEPIGPHSDLFMVGLVACEMLTGRKIHAGASEPKLLNERLAPNPVEIPDYLDEHPLGEILDKALRRDPQDRYQDASAMADALEALDEDRLREAQLPEVEAVSPVAPAMEEVPGDEEKSSETEDAGADSGIGSPDSAPSSNTVPPGADEKPSTGSFDSTLPSPDDLEAGDEESSGEQPSTADATSSSDASDVKVAESVEEAGAADVGESEGNASASGSIPAPSDHSSDTGTVGRGDEADAGTSIPAPGGDGTSDDSDTSGTVPSPDEAASETSGTVPSPDAASGDSSGTVPPQENDGTDAPDDTSPPPMPGPGSGTDEDADGGSSTPDAATAPAREDDSATPSASSPATAVDADLRGEPPQLLQLAGRLRESIDETLAAAGIENPVRPKVAAAGLGALFVAVVGGWFVFGGDGGSPEAQGSESAGDENAAAASAEEEDRETTVRIESNRDGARVVRGDVDLGETPVELTVDEPTTVEVDFEDRTKSLRLTPDSEPTRRVTFAATTADAGDATGDADAGDVGDTTDTADAAETDVQTDGGADTPEEEEDEADDPESGDRESADDEPTGTSPSRDDQGDRQPDDSDEETSSEDEEVPIFDY